VIRDPGKVTPECRGKRPSGPCERDTIYIFTQRVYRRVYQQILVWHTLVSWQWTTITAHSTSTIKRFSITPLLQRQVSFMPLLHGELVRVLFKCSMSH